MKNNKFIYFLGNIAKAWQLARNCLIFGQNNLRLMAQGAVFFNPREGVELVFGC